jgi:enamine deaminase RidA (YjgF/YER057c/UK114 family)
MGGADGPQFRRDAVIPASWGELYAATGIPVAVRSGEVIRPTGHTGDRADGTFSKIPEAHTRQTFQNVALTLSEAGLQWSDVVEIRTYRVGLRVQADVALRVALNSSMRPIQPGQMSASRSCSNLLRYSR